MDLKCKVISGGSCSFHGQKKQNFPNWFKIKKLMIQVFILITINRILNFHLNMHKTQIFNRENFSLYFHLLYNCTKIIQRSHTICKFQTACLNVGGGHSKRVHIESYIYWCCMCRRKLSGYCLILFDNGIKSTFRNHNIDLYCIGH